MFSQLRALLGVTRLVRTVDDLSDLLQAVAKTLGTSLGFGTVVLNLYRPEWDDFVVSTVVGSDAARDALLGRTRSVEEWKPLLDLRFLQRGAYLVPTGHYDWSADAEAWFAPPAAVSDAPDAWQPEDALFVPLRGTDGRLLGILSVDDPASGRRPAEEDIDVLVAVSEHAALALETAQESARARANREALSRLLDVSSRLNETRDASTLLDLVCAAISDALGFERVAVQLLDERGGSHHTVASAGFSIGENVGAPLSAADLDQLLRPEFDVAGCFLIPHEEARALLPARPPGYRSQRDGRGPHAWQNHWLFVPLHDLRGRRVGYIWADDPADRRRPDAERLQILRAFANLAATALDQAAQFDELQNAYERKNAVLRAVLDGVVIVDHDGRIAEVNPATEETFGWTRADALGRFFLDLAVAPEHRPELAGVLETGAGALLGTRVEITALRSDHRRFPAEIAITRVDVPGPLLLAVSVRDITRRRRGEERLTQSEARYRTLVEQLPLATYINEIGPVHRTTYMSPQIESMLGYPVADWLTEGFFATRLHPEDRERVLAEIERTARTSEDLRLDYRMLAADGRVVWVHDVNVAVRDSEYRPLMLQGCLLDVTEDYEQAEALRLSEELYRLVVESSADVIAVFALDGIAQYVSPAVEHVLGRAPETMVGARWPDLIHPDDVGPLRAYLESRLAGVERAPLASRIRRSDGSWVTLEGSISVVRDQAGEPSRFVAVCRPVAQHAHATAA